MPEQEWSLNQLPLVALLQLVIESSAKIALYTELYDWANTVLCRNLFKVAQM